MKKILLFAVGLFSLFFVETGAIAAQSNLIVFVVIDGLSYDRLQSEYSNLSSGGIRRLIDQGVVFNNAHHDYSTTFTGPGHATLMTGKYPSEHGIVGNEWIEKHSGRIIYCSRGKMGASPEWMLTKTFGDTIKDEDEDVKIFAVSSKERSAVLMSGQSGIPYYWSQEQKRFVSSPHYLKRYPFWYGKYYQAPRGTWNHISAADEYLNDFTMTLIREENLMQRSGQHPNVIGISYSSLDEAQHRTGTGSAESSKQLRKIDAYIQELLIFLDQTFGENNFLMVLTSDHGFASSEAHCTVHQSHEGYVVYGDETELMLRQKLAEKWSSKILLKWMLPGFYWNHQLIQENNWDVEEIEAYSIAFLESLPGIRAVYSTQQLFKDQDSKLDDYQLMVKKSVRVGRSPDLYVLQKLCWQIIPNRNLVVGSSHGTPYDYDTHVPLIFSGLNLEHEYQNQFISMTEVLSLTQRFWQENLTESGIQQ